jgi:hypothetical protein
MTPADERILQLLGKWRASLELHLRYARLSDDEYWLVQPWPRHERPTEVGHRARAPALGRPRAHRPDPPRRGRYFALGSTRADVVPYQPGRGPAYRALRAHGRARAGATDHPLAAEPCARCDGGDVCRGRACCSAQRARGRSGCGAGGCRGTRRRACRRGRRRDPRCRQAAALGPRLARVARGDRAHGGTSEQDAGTRHPEVPPQLDRATGGHEHARALKPSTAGLPARAAGVTRPSCLT